MGGRTMTGRMWIVAAALGVLLATGGVVALARALSIDGGVGGDGGAGGSVPPCVTSTTAEPARNAAGPTASPADPAASPGTDDYWTPERMRDATGAGQGENADGSTPPGPTPTCH